MYYKTSFLPRENENYFLPKLSQNKLSALLSTIQLQSYSQPHKCTHSSHHWKWIIWKKHGLNLREDAKSYKTRGYWKNIKLWHVTVKWNHEKNILGGSKKRLTLEESEIIAKGKHQLKIDITGNRERIKCVCARDVSGFAVVQRLGFYSFTGSRLEIGK